PGRPRWFCPGPPRPRATRDHATGRVRAARSGADNPTARCGNAVDKAGRRTGWKPTTGRRARAENNFGDRPAQRLFPGIPGPAVRCAPARVEAVDVRLPSDSRPEL